MTMKQKLLAPVIILSLLLLAMFLMTWGYRGSKRMMFLLLIWQAEDAEPENDKGNSAFPICTQ